jgi:hypothetical protein
MKPTYENRRTMIAAFLVSFMIVTDIGLMLTDPLRLQRTFGALLSAELVAFATLVYVAGGTRRDKIAGRWLLIQTLALVILLSLTLILP